MSLSIRLLKSCDHKQEKIVSHSMLVSSIFSFSHNVFSLPILVKFILLSAIAEELIAALQLLSYQRI